MVDWFTGILACGFDASNERRYDKFADCWSNETMSSPEGKDSIEGSICWPILGLVGDATISIDWGFDSSTSDSLWS
jgi:hypothetical protein